MSSLLTVRHINCRYGDKVIIGDLSFGVPAGGIVCLLGPSGCGKTTALRALAGFEPVHAGSIELEGRTLSSPGRSLPPEQRQVGMVFQDYALFPHMKVRENIAFGLHRRPAAERHEAVEQLLALVKLEDYAEAWPHQLSGGQQQRVALARALAPRPRVLLLDEPFSSLDTELRRSLSVEVREILKRRGTSAVLVTHDQAEAFNMADEIGVMEAGALRQWGTPRDLFQRPANRFVASFICNGRFIDGTAAGEGEADTPFGRVRLDNASGLPAGTSLRILVRPWNLTAAKPDNGLRCEGEIVQQQFQGAASSTSVRLSGGSVVESNDEKLTPLPVGTRVTLELSQQGLLGFAEEDSTEGAPP